MSSLCRTSEGQLRRELYPVARCWQEVADVTFGGEVDVSIPVTIGNIPHKKSFQTFDNKDGELHRLTIADFNQKYPNLPGYTGEKYISYKSV